MDRYDAVEAITTICATLNSIHNGDDTAAGEFYLTISVDTVNRLKKSADQVKDWIKTIERREDEIYG